VRKHGYGDRIPPPPQPAGRGANPRRESIQGEEDSSRDGVLADGAVRRERGLRARERDHPCRPGQPPSQAIIPDESARGIETRGEGREEEAGTTRREGREANGEVKDDGDPAMRLR
jgi:hypothetical protein